MSFRKIAVIAALALLVTPWMQIAAAESTPSSLHTIEVNGDGSVQAAPDQATLQLAIETHATTAAEAAGSNGALAQKVRDALKSKLQDKGLMWTGGYSLYPDYSEARNGGEAKIIGYRTQNSITVQTGALELVGPLIDAAIKAGANRVGSLDYDLRDNSQARGEAITRATKDAETQAQALASALGVKLGPIVKATAVSEARPVPMMRMQASPMMANSATPVEAGQVTVPASVSLSYQIE
jgi:uncharacterized protein